MDITYKIKFKMSSPIAYTDIPIFDSIISYAVYQKYFRKNTDIKTSNGSEINKNIEKLIPIKKHKLGFYLCSYGIIEKKEISIDKWRKRWNSRHDFLSYFGKAKRKVNIGSGYYKSYDMPIVINSVDNIVFYFIGDKNKIKELVDYIVGIGKKVKAGFGWFSSFEITIAEKEEQKYLLFRPLPLKVMADNIFKDRDFSYVNDYGSYRAPYWLGEYQENILIPKQLKENNERYS